MDLLGMRYRSVLRPMFILGLLVMAIVVVMMMLFLMHMLPRLLLRLIRRNMLPSLTPPHDRNRILPGTLPRPKKLGSQPPIARTYTASPSSSNTSTRSNLIPPPSLLKLRHNPPQPPPGLLRNLLQNLEHLVLLARVRQHARRDGEAADRHRRHAAVLDVCDDAAHLVRVVELGSSHFFGGVARFEGVCLSEEALRCVVEESADDGGALDEPV